VNEFIEIDRWLFDKINSQWTTELFDNIFPVLTDLHQNKLAVPIFLILLSIWFWRKRKSAIRIFLMILLATIASDTIAYRVVKPLVSRVRPEFSELPVILRTHSHSGLSFPSNHAANNFAIATVLSFYYGKFALVFFYLRFSNCL